MKITIENTSKIVNLDGVPARIWEGRTESGIAVICYITRIAAPIGENQSEFQHELQQVRNPSPAAEAIPLRLII